MNIRNTCFSRFSIISQFILLIFLSFSVFGEAGDIDTSFNPYLATAPIGQVYNSVIQPDGKIIVVGNFNVVNGVARENIVRLNQNGSVDQSFNAPPIEVIKEVLLQSDGKILILGSFFWVGDTPRRSIARLNADGSPDNAFNTNPGLNNFQALSVIAIAPDDEIYIGGAKAFGQSVTNVLSRLNSDGSLGAEISPGYGSVSAKVQSDGKLITNRFYDLRRVNTDLTVDNTFALVQPGPGGGVIYDFFIQPDGKSVIGGSFTEINGSPLRRVARINTDGSVDLTFNINLPGPNAKVDKMTPMPGGKILIAGDFTSVNNTPKAGLALLNSDGTLDDSFTPAAAIPVGINVFDMDVQADGKIIITSSIRPPFSTIHGQVYRLNPDGSIDTSFQFLIGDYGTANKALIMPDNKILIGGYFTHANNLDYGNFVRFNTDGTLDTSFHQTTFNVTVNFFDSFADGKIIAGSGNSFIGVHRLNADGSHDIIYEGTTGGYAGGVKALADGKALISTSTGLFRYNADGTRDKTFNANVTGIGKIVFQPDGKILITGSFTQVNGTGRGGVARLNDDGSLDASFNPPGGANTGISDLTLRSDGKIYVCGSFTGINFTNRKYLALLNPDGSLDTSFNHAIDKAVYALRLQPDGKLLIGGAFDNIGPDPRHKFTRLNADGTLDRSFDDGYGANNIVRDIEIQSNGRIIIVGDFSSVNLVHKPGIARLLNTSKTMFDFDGDSKSDISIFRPGAGEWWYSRSSDGGNYAAQFGNSTDKLVPGDFTGDGRADIAVFRPSTGEWFILRSEDGSYYSYPFGTAGDIPSVGDFDGDGKSDSAVFRPSDTNWYIRRSSDGGFTIQQFGANGDVPVVSDYDGDGKSDIAIWRASVGEWWIQKSSNSSVVAFQFGNSADKPVQGDYTGDGKADAAIFRPVSGEWFILRSEDFSYYSFPFGANGDIPAPGDYDGDGKFDATVFRPSGSTWYVQRSTAGTLIQSFGQSGDMPIPYTFVP